jgi:hypothetical protein
MSVSYIQKLIEVVQGDPTRQTAVVADAAAGALTVVTGASGTSRKVHKFTLLADNGLNSEVTVELLDGAGVVFPYVIPKNTQIDVDLNLPPWTLGEGADLVVNKSAALDKFNLTVFYS